MTQEDKDLLLKDLCARLPYGVKVEDRNGTHILSIGNTEFTDLFGGKYNIKPYLRPMSSMTEKEVKEYKAFHCVVHEHTYFYPQFCTVANELNMFDWLNEHHFDYRGLIEKGLAIEAPNEIYNNQK